MFVGGVGGIRAVNRGASVMVVVGGRVDGDMGAVKSDGIMGKLVLLRMMFV